MPEMDGYEQAICQRVKRSASPRPWKSPVHIIIALTAHALQEERAKYLAAGMDDTFASRCGKLTFKPRWSIGRRRCRKDTDGPRNQGNQQPTIPLPGLPRCADATNHSSSRETDFRRRGVAMELIHRLVFPSRICSNLDVIDMSKLKLGEPLPGYRFKPGECVVNSNFTEEFRQGICTQKELDDLKMLVIEVGIDKNTQTESYRLLYYSTVGGNKIPWNQIDQWWSKADVESMCEPCDHPCGLIKGSYPESS